MNTIIEPSGTHIVRNLNRQTLNHTLSTHTYDSYCDSSEEVLEVEEASGGYGNWYDEALKVICGYGEWCEEDRLEASGGYGEAEGLPEVCIVRAGVNS